jgi:hypothetical protein
MERLESIATVEYAFRRRGVFLLVDFDGKKLWFFGHKPDQVAIKQMMESMKGRTEEMVKFLIARARVPKG